MIIQNIIIMQNCNFEKKVNDNNEHYTRTKGEMWDDMMYKVVSYTLARFFLITKFFTRTTKTLFKIYFL